MSSRQVEAALSMARRSLIDYCILLQKNYSPNWHHELIAKKLEDVADGKTKRLMLFMPPRHGKSELATKKFPAWYLGRNPNKEIICCSYSADLSDEFGRATRDTVSDPLHKAAFPECFLKSTGQSATRWRVGRERGGFMATGVGGSITGMGADILIIDDPVKNREEANSAAFRNKVWNWYTSTAYTRLEKGGAVIVIMTRWHDDDLAGRLLEREGEKGMFRDPETGVWKKEGARAEEGLWDVVRFPAISIEEEKFRGIGEPLWENKYDLDSLRAIKKTVGIRDWSALYQQDPVDAEAQFFKDDWIQYWKELPNKLRYVTAVDPAVSKKASADDSVVLTLGMAADDRMYIVDIKAWHASPTELINEIFRQQEKWNSTVGIETVAYQQSIMHYMLLEQKRRRRYISVQKISSTIQKEARIKRLEPYYSNGLLFHPPGGSDKLEEQLKRFPVGKHDDVIDALATAVQLVRRPANNNKAAKLNQTIGLAWGRDGKPYIS